MLVRACYGTNVVVYMSSGNSKPTPATDMFAFGQTVSQVAHACDPQVDSDVVPAANLVAALTKQDPQQRLTAKQALNHTFFAPAKQASGAQTAECHLALGGECPEGCTELSMGVTCAGGHFVCASCIESLMQHAFNPASDSPGAARSRLSDGRIHCPHCMSNIFSDAQLVKALPASICDEYLLCRMEFVKNRQRSELEAEMISEMQLQLEKLQAMDDVQRKVLLARKYIEEELLQMKCPSCRAAFYDFDGCFALNCARYAFLS
jgi:hypothetical protein